jgi:hypothetical protein
MCSWCNRPTVLPSYRYIAHTIMYGTLLFDDVQLWYWFMYLPYFLSLFQNAFLLLTKKTYLVKQCYTSSNFIHLVFIVFLDWNKKSNWETDPDHLGLHMYSWIVTQQWNQVMTHLSVHIAMGKPHMTVFANCGKCRRIKRIVTLIESYWGLG